MSKEEFTGVVLLVEDNQLDMILARECFNEVAPSIDIYDTKNGSDALSFLRREGEFADAPIPDLVLLDLNLPMMSGLEVLAALRNDEGLKHLPVLILTNSHSDEDILSTYRLQARSYIRKPVDFEQFVEMTRRIVDYWFGLVSLPRTQSRSVQQ